MMPIVWEIIEKLCRQGIVSVRPILASMTPQLAGWVCLRVHLELVYNGRPAQADLWAFFLEREARRAKHNDWHGWRDDGGEG